MKAWYLVVGCFFLWIAHPKFISETVAPVGLTLAFYLLYREYENYKIYKKYPKEFRPLLRLEEDDFSVVEASKALCGGGITIQHLGHPMHLALAGLAESERLELTRRFNLGVDIAAELIKEKVEEISKTPLRENNCKLPPQNLYENLKIQILVLSGKMAYITMASNKKFTYHVFFCYLHLIAERVLNLYPEAKQIGIQTSYRSHAKNIVSNSRFVTNYFHWGKYYNECSDYAGLIAIKNKIESKLSIS